MYGNGELTLLRICDHLIFIYTVTSRYSAQSMSDSSDTYVRKQMVSTVITYGYVYLSVWGYTPIMTSVLVDQSS